MTSQTWTPEHEHELAAAKRQYEALAELKKVVRDGWVQHLADLLDNLDIGFRYSTTVQIADDMGQHADKLIAALQPFATKEQA